MPVDLQQVYRKRCNLNLFFQEVSDSHQMIRTDRQSLAFIEFDLAAHRSRSLGSTRQLHTNQ